MRVSAIQKPPRAAVRPYGRASRLRVLLLGLALLLSGCGASATTASQPTASAVTSTSATAASASTSPASVAASTTDAMPSTTSATPTTASVSTGSAASASEATSSAASASTNAAPASTSSVASASTSAGTTASSSVAASATTYPLTVKDDQGTSVTFAAKPHHVVSLAPSNTEIIYAVGAGDDLVAGTQYDNYPPAAKSKALIKGLKPSLEALLTYQPDLVLASSSNASDLVQQLRATHVPVLYLDPHDFAGVYHDITLVGEVLNDAAKAQQVVAGMQRQVADVTAQTAKATTKPRVFVELDASDPTKIFTVGPGSFIDTMIGMAGGTNVAHDANNPYPQLGLEALLSANPQVIILNDAAYGVTKQQVMQRPGWSALAAVKDGRIEPINDDLVSRPGPRLAAGLAAIAKIIHPELFP